MFINNLYEIIESSKTDSGISVRIFIDKNHNIFLGHFPENPVLPGVCMIQIVKELVENAMGKKLRMEQVTNVKFLGLINPEIHPHLQMEITIATVEEKIKVKNISTYDNTVALKMNAIFNQNLNDQNRFSQ